MKSNLQPAEAATSAHPPATDTAELSDHDDGSSEEGFYPRSDGEGDDTAMIGSDTESHEMGQDFKMPDEEDDQFG